MTAARSPYRKYPRRYDLLSRSPFLSGHSIWLHMGACRTVAPSQGPSYEPASADGPAGGGAAAATLDDGIGGRSVGASELGGGAWLRWHATLAVASTATATVDGVRRRRSMVEDGKGF